MSDIAAIDNDLNQKILTGKALEAFDEYYADDVVMQENSEPPFEGKELNRKREVEFFSSVKEWHNAELQGSALNGDTSFSQWHLDITLNNGYRVASTQIAVRRWKDGKIVHERFFYNKGA